jgi:hypothetical protein
MVFARLTQRHSFLAGAPFYGGEMRGRFKFRYHGRHGLAVKQASHPTWAKPGSLCPYKLFNQHIRQDQIWLDNAALVLQL